MISPATISIHSRRNRYIDYRLPEDHPASDNRNGCRCIQDLPAHCQQLLTINSVISCIILHPIWAVHNETFHLYLQMLEIPGLESSEVILCKLKNAVGRKRRRCSTGMTNLGWCLGTSDYDRWFMWARSWESTPAQLQCMNIETAVQGIFDWLLFSKFSNELNNMKIKEYVQIRKTKSMRRSIIRIRLRINRHESQLNRPGRLRFTL